MLWFRLLLLCGWIGSLAFCLAGCASERTLEEGVTLHSAVPYREATVTAHIVYRQRF